MQYKVGDLVEYPVIEGQKLHLVVGKRGVYYRLQCVRTGEYYNIIAKWIRRPTLEVSCNIK
jgi:hypothetical protein